MSAKAVIQITCDGCSETFDGKEVFSVRQVRGEARREGWEVGVTPTPERPAENDDFADFCPNCKSNASGDGRRNK